MNWNWINRSASVCMCVCVCVWLMARISDFFLALLVAAPVDMTTLNFTRIETGRTTRYLIASLSLWLSPVHSLSLSLAVLLTLSLLFTILSLSLSLLARAV